MNPVIARRRLFSTAHFYEQKRWAAEKNAAVFGPCYSKHGHGHNYVLEVFVEGPIDPGHGLVINVNDLDIVMKKVIAPFDHKHISFDVPEFQDIVPTTENLASYFHRKLKPEIANLGLKLARIRLFETDDLWVVTGETPVGKGFELTREFVIRSMHHLENSKWSSLQNSTFYGICYGLHGHDYHVQVTVRGAFDERTGLAVDRDALDRLLEQEIRSKYDGVDLNKRFTNTSCEQLAVEFYEILKPLIKGLVRVGIQETRKNYFEFPSAAGPLV